MLSFRGFLFLALLPGLVSPAGLALRLCFCWLFDAHGDHGCSHREAPLEPGSHEDDHVSHEHSKRLPESGSEGYSTHDPEHCFCVTISVPRQPAGGLAVSSIAVDVPAMDHPALAAVPDIPRPGYPSLVDLGESSVPPTLTRRTLPLLI